jgi:hypothetical protein
MYIYGPFNESEISVSVAGTRGVLAGRAIIQPHLSPVVQIIAWYYYVGISRSKCIILPALTRRNFKSCFRYRRTLHNLNSNYYVCFLVTRDL